MKLVLPLLSILVAVTAQRKVPAHWLRSEQESSQGRRIPKEAGSIEDEASLWHHLLAQRELQSLPPTMMPRTPSPTSTSGMMTPRPTRPTGTLAPTEMAPTGGGQVVPTAAPVPEATEAPIASPVDTLVPTPLVVVGPNPTSSPVATTTPAPSAEVVVGPEPTPSPLGVVTDPPIAPGEDTMFDVISTTTGLTTLTTAVETADLEVTLTSLDVELTVFGPLDDGFASDLEATYLTALLTPEYNLHLRYLLLNHVAHKELFAEDLSDGLEVKLMSGETSTVVNNETGVYLQTFAASQGVADDVMLLTVDIGADNGVLHTLDGVLNPIWYYYDVSELIMGLPDQLSLLEELLEAAGLDESLLDFRGYTILAPDNKAIKALTPPQLAYLQANPDVLLQVLQYHVLTTIVNTKTFPIGVTPAETLEGSPVDVGVKAGDDRLAKFTFNGAKANTPFLTRWNIVYVIHRVLVPPGVTLPP